ncbi:Mitogen-activated protein kinase kinase kinase 4 [Aphelenchoides fujianensis]|nr:Mitogen-activated protein kinase kinase kinase 4 [Aphelenchoides fujianensis]
MSTTESGLEAQMAEMFASNPEETFVSLVQRVVDPVRVDIRDPWPTRGCLLKSVDLRRLYTHAVEDRKDAKKRSFLQIQTPDVRLNRVLRRIVMELLILTRCRHENILHAHAVFIENRKLHVAMPQFHVLRDLIELYRNTHDHQPISMDVIARIIRQLCKALDYLHSMGVVHRDVQPERILLTRGGTVKLTHFAQSKPLASEKMRAECRTPVGKEEFMSVEKLFNFRCARTVDACRSYSFESDIWSLGVLVLSMVSYFPQERYQKLRKDFALVLDREQMPFIWLISEMVQIRARLLKSGGEDLKHFLNDHLLTVDPADRLTARGILESERFLKWCSQTVGEDKKFLQKHFIGEIDFSNRQKLATDGINFDCLESKNIPAMFYWDDSWKIVEHTDFIFRVCSVDGQTVHGEKKFQFQEPEPLVSFLFELQESGVLGLADVIPAHISAYVMTNRAGRADGAARQEGRQFGRRSGGLSRVRAGRQLRRRPLCPPSSSSYQGPADLRGPEAVEFGEIRGGGAAPAAARVLGPRYAFRDFYSVVSDRFKPVDRAVQTAKETVVSTDEYLRREGTILPKAAAITIGGMAGFVLGLRRSGFRKLLYTTTGLLTMAAFTYPYEAIEFSQIGLAHAQRTWEDFKKAPPPPAQKKN